MRQKDRREAVFLFQTVQIAAGACGRNWPIPAVPPMRRGGGYWGQTGRASSLPCAAVHDPQRQLAPNSCCVARCSIHARFWAVPNLTLNQAGAPRLVT